MESNLIISHNKVDQVHQQNSAILMNLHVHLSERRNKIMLKKETGTNADLHSIRQSGDRFDEDQSSKSPERKRKKRNDKRKQEYKCPYCKYSSIYSHRLKILERDHLYVRMENEQRDLNKKVN